MNVYEDIIRNKVNAAAGKQICDDINQLLHEPEEKASEIIQILLSYACNPTHIAPITYSRECLRQLPSEWVSSKIKDCVFKSVNIYDDWEYRRLLELSEMISEELLEWVISIARYSDNPDIIEAAEDFKVRKSSRIEQ